MVKKIVKRTKRRILIDRNCQPDSKETLKRIKNEDKVERNGTRNYPEEMEIRNRKLLI